MRSPEIPKKQCRVPWCRIASGRGAAPSGQHRRSSNCQSRELLLPVARGQRNPERLGHAKGMLVVEHEGVRGRLPEEQLDVALLAWHLSRQLELEVLRGGALDAAPEVERKALELL